MFHDINDTPVAGSRTKTVIDLWAELRARTEFQAVEFLDHSSDAPTMGIGLLCSKTIA